MCFDYTFTNEYSKGVCKQDLQTGFKEQCSNCKKFSYSKDCFEKHKKLPMKYCNSVKTCVKCNAFYRQHHVCYQKKCFACFKYHDKGDFCEIQVKSIRYNIQIIEFVLSVPIMRFWLVWLWFLF